MLYSSYELFNKRLERVRFNKLGDAYIQIVSEGVSDSSWMGHGLFCHSISLLIINDSTNDFSMRGAR